MKKMIKALTALALLLALAPASQAAADRRTPVVQAVERALPSVVNIGTERLVKVRHTDPYRRFRGDLFDQFFSEFFGQPQSPGYRVAHSLGSGVIIHPKGYILTNYHVIERASKIHVTLADESSYDAVFLAGDDLSDLALIKIEPHAPLQAVQFAQGDDLLLGETVIALGNPFGLAQTVTVGVLSAKNREARFDGQTIFKDILQTDAAINFGSSGGPLLNLDGEMIGINVSIYRDAQNIGFAVPVARARQLLASWFSPRLIGKMTPGFEPESRDGKVLVAYVDETAKQAGIRVEDVIKSIGGVPVKDLFDVNRTLLGYGPEQQVVLEVEREGQVFQASTMMTVLPKPSGPKLAARLLGLRFSDRQTAQWESRRPIKGLTISEVADGSISERAGLRAGLLVTRINDIEINNLDDVGIALENVRSGEMVILTIVSFEEAGQFILAQSSSVQLPAE